MRLSSSLLACCLIVTQAALAQPLASFGLEGKTVTAMHEFAGTLYAATPDSGVYRRYLADPDSGWKPLGVPAKTLTSIFAFHTVCPLICWKGILAGAAADLTVGDSTLIYFYQQRPDTCQKPGAWLAASKGIDAVSVRRIQALAGVAVCQPIGPEFVTAFAAGQGAIFRSLDRGQSWQQVWQRQSHDFRVLAASQRSWLDPLGQEIWAGGHFLPDTLDNAWRPLIMLSRNAGEQWEDLSPAHINWNERCVALAPDPADTNRIYAALTHTILRSWDRGRSWQAVFPMSPAITFTALAVDPQTPQHLLASGSAGNNAAVLYESRNGGDEWQMLPLRPLLIAIGSMIFDPFPADPPALPRSVYLATSGSGVWRYTFAETSVRDTPAKPEDFHLEMTFPNPARQTAGAALTFRVLAPVPEPLTIRLYNTLGQQLGFWRVPVHSGGQSFTLPFSPASLTAGVYFVHAEWRGRVIVKKWTVLP